MTTCEEARDLFHELIDTSEILISERQSLNSFFDFVAWASATLAVAGLIFLFK